MGLVAGYYGGWIDTILARFMDILLSFPVLLFALAIVARFGPSLGLVDLRDRDVQLAAISAGWSGARSSACENASSSRRPARSGRATSASCSSRSRPT